MRYCAENCKIGVLFWRHLFIASRCADDWDKKITTPPGLYLMSTLLHRLSGLACSLEFLRLSNFVSLCVLPIASYKCRTQVMLHTKRVLIGVNHYTAISSIKRCNQECADNYDISFSIFFPLHVLHRALEPRLRPVRIRIVPGIRNRQCPLRKAITYFCGYNITLHIDCIAVIFAISRRLQFLLFWCVRRTLYGCCLLQDRGCWGI